MQEAHKGTGCFLYNFFISLNTELLHLAVLKAGLQSSHLSSINIHLPIFKSFCIFA